MKVTDNHVFFWSGFLSNFYPCHINFEGHAFHCSEQLFMYLKAKFFDDNITAKLILEANTPKEAKALGRQVQNFSEELWRNYRMGFMAIAVFNKFSQNKDLQDKLLSNKYRGKIFVEASPYDTIWGIGMGEDNPDVTDTSKWKGLNLLGKVLTDCREWMSAYLNSLPVNNK